MPNNTNKNGTLTLNRAGSLVALNTSVAYFAFPLWELLKVRKKITHYIRYQSYCYMHSFLLESLKFIVLYDFAGCQPIGTQNDTIFCL